jgi:hypothetical protein
MGKRAVKTPAPAAKGAGGGTMQSMRAGFRSAAGRGRGSGMSPVTKRFMVMLLSMFGAGLILYALLTR